MPSFICDGCQDVLKKPKLDQHANYCRNFYGYSCIDCSKQFSAQKDWKVHTTCITEEQKYHGKFAKTNTGKQNQNQNQNQSVKNTNQAINAKAPTNLEKKEEKTQENDKKKAQKKADEVVKKTEEKSKEGKSEKKDKKEKKNRKEESSKKSKKRKLSEADEELPSPKKRKIEEKSEKSEKSSKDKKNKKKSEKKSESPVEPDKDEAMEEETPTVNKPVEKQTNVFTQQVWDEILRNHLSKHPKSDGIKKKKLQSLVLRDLLERKGDIKAFLENEFLFQVENNKKIKEENGLIVLKKKGAKKQNK